MTQVRRTRRRWPVWCGIAMAMVVPVLGLAAPAAAAEGTILGAGVPNAIKDSYIVELKGGANARPAKSLASRYGATITHTYRHAVQGFAATLTEAAARRLAADPAVLRVQQDVTGSVDGTQFNPPSHGLDRIDQRIRPLLGSYTYPNTASNVVAYIIDTGIRITHQEFGGRAYFGINTYGGPNTDCYGHGTHVAGTVGGATYGVAKGLLLVSVKVGDCLGNVNASAVLNGVDWVTAHHTSGPAVANMSLGFTPPVPTIETAVRNSIADGIVYTVASGNSGADACAATPARVGEAITVNATDPNDFRASFSNFGACTDIFAPGVNITSAGKDTDTGPAVLSGTSMAAPHVAGAAALVLSANPGLNPQQVAGTLYANATLGLVGTPGAGSPNRMLFVAQPTPPAPASGPDRLIRGQSIPSGQALHSQNGQYTLAMQSDGNLVLYNQASQVIWHSSTYGNPGAFSVFQTDGNFVLYRADGVALWHVATNGTAANRFLVQNDGNLVITGPDGQLYWHRLQ